MPACQPAPRNQRRPTGECRAKGLIYQDADRPLTPVRKGTKGRSMIPEQTSNHCLRRRLLGCTYAPSSGTSSSRHFAPGWPCCDTGPPAGFLQHGAAPFATADVPDEAAGGRYPEDFHLINKHQGVTGKASAVDWLPRQLQHAPAHLEQHLQQHLLALQPLRASPTHQFAPSAVESILLLFCCFANCCGAPVLAQAGADGFDASVYSSNLESNRQNMAESKMRNYAGAAGRSSTLGSTSTPAWRLCTR